MKTRSNTAAAKPKLSFVHQLIQEATGAPAADLSYIEHIMRTDIFHSTLDWQTAAQLRIAAREAYALLNENRDLYEYERKQALSFFTTNKH